MFAMVQEGAGYDPFDTDTIADLTRRYARFSLSAGGLASVLGGGLAIVAYFVGALRPPDAVAGRVALALMPLLWIAAKELLRMHYYQRFGRVAQVRTAAERRWHVGFTIFTLAVASYVVGAVLNGLPGGLWSLGGNPGLIGYLSFVAAMPVLVWYFMRTPLEFIVGVFLMAQAALALVGRHYGLGQQLQAPIAGLVLIVIGVKQHLDFRSIERRLARADRT